LKRNRLVLASGVAPALTSLVAGRALHSRNFQTDGDTTLKALVDESSMLPPRPVTP
jgi:hypothetical protein